MSKEAKKSFLTDEEIRATKAAEEDRFGSIGRVDAPDIEEYKMQALKKAFSYYPAQFTPSVVDWLYYYPYDRDDFHLRLREEREKDIDLSKVQNKGRLPWTYQTGRIFKAKLIKQSEKALLLRLYIGAIWVPRTQVDFEPDEVWLPQWLIDDKCLDIEEALPEPAYEVEPFLLAKGPQVVPPRSKMKQVKG